MHELPLESAIAVAEQIEAAKKDAVTISTPEMDAAVPVAVKIPKVEILIGQNPDSRNPERSKSRMGQNPDRSESRQGRKCTVKCGLASVVH
ncbi:hypothetical protein M513_08425 [Trichuris suis]|uniref:Uncharacterized protein n=1 Tax=Trichuris suis TaxID=68888 RepID=A0A085M072_9BILA|nr:hypothetical protein M513_08425 [Trichuris suis]